MGILYNYTCLPACIVVFPVYGDTPEITTRMFCGATTFYLF